MNETLPTRIHEMFPRYVKTLEDLIRIPSISFDNFDQNEVLRSANAVKELFENHGFENAQFLTPPSGRPSVFAELKTNPKNPRKRSQRPNSARSSVFLSRYLFLFFPYSLQKRKA